MDDLVDQSKIARLKKIEDKGRAAARADVWDKAAQHYSELYDFAQGWLARNDPNVLWAQVYLTEAWVRLNRLDDAIAAHQELFSLIGRPDADEEREVLKYIMQLQGGIANKLIAYKRIKDAERLLLNALEKCNEAFSHSDPITCRIRENYNKLLGYKEDRSKKKMDRLRASMQSHPHIHTIEGDSVEQSPRKSITGSIEKSPQSPHSDGSPSSVRHPSSFLTNPSIAQPTGLGINLREPGVTTADFSSGSANGQQMQEPTPANDRPRSSSARLSHEFLRPSGTGGRPQPPANPFARQSGRSSNTTTRPGWSEPLQSDGPQSAQLSPQLAPVSLSQELGRSKSVDLRSQRTSSNSIFGELRDAGERFSDARLLSDTDESKNIDADEWFTVDLKPTHNLLGSSALSSGAGKRPRIAIIDTGLNAAHPEVSDLLAKTAREKRIQGFWVPEETKWSADQDHDGHGTHCAMVAHQTAPNADLFIAKAFLDDRNMEGKYVVEALIHAITVWKVDIVSMSFKISQYDEHTKTAMVKIFETHKDQVLLFAAASNSGSNSGRAFPAKRPEVIGVHAAYGKGASWKNNPKPYTRDYPYNFSTLGINVKAPHRDDATERMRGTSVATPVAAGIAALVLEFCRQPDISSGVLLDKPTRLKAKEGMARIFRQMYNHFDSTVDDSPDHHFYLRPWQLMACLDEKELRNPKLARQRIAMVINGALNSLDD